MTSSKDHLVRFAVTKIGSLLRKVSSLLALFSSRLAKTIWRFDKWEERMTFGSQRLGNKP